MIPGCDLAIHSSTHLFASCSWVIFQRRRFLDTPTHLYKRSFPFVHPSVHWFVRLSIMLLLKQRKIAKFTKNLGSVCRRAWNRGSESVNHSLIQSITHSITYLQARAHHWLMLALLSHGLRISINLYISWSFGLSVAQSCLSFFVILWVFFAKVLLPNRIWLMLLCIRPLPLPLTSTFMYLTLLDAPSISIRRCVCPSVCPLVRLSHSS